MNNSFNVEFPYPIGTYLSKEEDGVTRIDQLYEYVIDKNGVSVVVILDALTNPRLSVKIDMDVFLNNWAEAKKPNDKVYSKQKNR